MTWIDTRTRYQGVYARHKVGCAVGSGGRCRCKPSYYGVVYDQAVKRQIKTRRFPSADAAKKARSDLATLVERGEALNARPIRLSEARERFAAAAREGKALNKRGHRYKPRAVDNIEEALRIHVEPALGTKRIANIRRGDVQRIVDELAPQMSGSRVRAVVNSLRSVYRWAQDRDLVTHDPAALVRLPAMNATPISRIASPSEFAELLRALPIDVALPYALAGYGMGRRAQILHLAWTDVDLDVGAIEWGTQWAARKYEASRRVVPVVPQLTSLLKRRYLELGRPSAGLVCPPHAGWATSRLLNPGWVAKRARDYWETAGLEPITLQEARHTAATWLDAAGVPPKVASVLMGHATPARQQGAAPITLERYTHALPEDLGRARDLLAAYIEAAEALKVAR